MKEEKESQGCCEPECGPETCGSESESKGNPGTTPNNPGSNNPKASEGGYCEPDCTPETCECE